MYTSLDCFSYDGLDKAGIHLTATWKTFNSTSNCPIQFEGAQTGGRELMGEISKQSINISHRRDKK